VAACGRLFCPAAAGRRVPCADSASGTATNSKATAKILNIVWDFISILLVLQRVWNSEHLWGSFR
jgi:hypothetical protein